MTQTESVLSYLNAHGSITSIQAINSFGCTRLAARIKDLECQGYDIPRETVEVHNRHGKKVRVTQYKRPTVQQRLFA